MYKQLELEDNEHYEFDEVLKRKSIEEFTKFVNNHSFIKVHLGTSVTEEFYALGFLRARRYMMPKAKELFERSNLFVKQNPEICILNEENFTKSLKIYDSGAITVMKERDAMGRRIVLFAVKKLDASKFTINDTMRFISILLYTLVFEEESQKNGIIFIHDLSELSIDHVKLFPFKILKNFSSYINVCAVRVKEIYVFGLPSIAVQLYKTIQYLLDDKNKKRLKVMSDASKMWNFVDQNLMTKELGGKSYSEAEALTDFKKCIMEHKDDVIMLSNNIEIDMEKAKKFHKIKENRSKNKSDKDVLLEFD